MKDFRGIVRYTRQPEGFLSPELIVFVTSLIAVMIALAIVSRLCDRF